MTLEEQRAAVFEVALRITRAISEWRAAELKAIHKAAVTEYKGDPWTGGPRVREMKELYEPVLRFEHDTYEGGPTQHALWSIQVRLMEEFEQIISQERFKQTNPAGLLDLPAKVSALKENCERVMKVIEGTQASDMRFMLGIRGLAITLKPKYAEILWERLES